MSIFDEGERLSGKLRLFWGRSTAERVGLTAVWAAAAGLNMALQSSNVLLSTHARVEACLAIAGCNLAGAAVDAARDAYHHFSSHGIDKTSTSVLRL